MIKEGEELVKEYAVYSPNNKFHELYQVKGCTPDDYLNACVIVDGYLTTDGIHRDRQASVIYRWVSEWEYEEGFPKSHNEIERMREEQKKGKK